MDGTRLLFVVALLCAGHPKGKENTGSVCGVWWEGGRVVLRVRIPHSHFG